MNEILTLINLLGDYKLALLYGYLENIDWRETVHDGDILSDLKFSKTDLIRTRGALIMREAIKVEYLPDNAARYEIRGL